MNKNLLILGAGQYGTVAKEIAEEMGCFDKIDFLDDTFGAGETEGDYHEQSIGKLSDLDKFTDSYTYAICAIGNAETRQLWTNRITEECYRIPVLVSPRAFVSKSTQLRHGDIIEPMAVVHANAVVGIATYVSAGAVLNHNSFTSDYCHINCNSVVLSGAIVSPYTKTLPCEVIRANPSKFTLEKAVIGGVETTTVKNEKLPITPVGDYNFDDVM
ncbi:MAG: PglB [Eubacteriales bacterium]|nr:PglB [Eubacteriales bacterium]